MELTADPGLTLNAFTAKPGSASADVLNGPRRSAEPGHGSVVAERGAGRILTSAAPPPYDAGTSPKTASPDGGTSGRRYRDREHVNGLGYGGLPVGVVPAALRAAAVAGRRRLWPRLRVRVTAGIGKRVLISP